MRNLYIIRHGQSEGNANPTVYSQIPDWKVVLTPRGIEQCKETGEKLREMIGNRKISVAYSPMHRAKHSWNLIKMSVMQNIEVEWEEPFLIEQQFGNMTSHTRDVMRERGEFGEFFYTIPDGESGVDVYTRISTFLTELRLNLLEDKPDCDLVFITHGMTAKVLEMKLTRMNVATFHASNKLKNAEILKLQINF